MVAFDSSWTNWGQNQSATPAFTYRPETEAAAISDFRAALECATEVRPLGAGHSFSPLVPTAGAVVDMRRLTGLTDVDTARRRARIRGGTLISDLGPELWSHGLALANQGDIDRQTIAGACATGTHGSGARLGTLSSAVTWMRLIDGAGQVREIGEDRMRELRAARTSLGALGLVLELELQLVEAYHLEEIVDYPDWPEVQGSAASMAATWRHFSYLYLPRTESPELYELPVPADWTPGSTCYRKRYREVAADQAPREGQAVDRSYRVYPGSFSVKFHELEYFLPASQAREAATGVRELLATPRHRGQAYPLEVRWVRGDDAYLSPSSGRDSVTISVSGKPGESYEPYLRDVHEVLAGLGGRPHWGKLHYFTGPELRSIYPGFSDFEKVRREFDPRSKLLNTHLRDLMLEG
jgi:FAD/FMN-containing dehydrogenase